MKITLFTAGLFVLLLVSCKQDKEIKVYRVAKETPTAAADPHAGMPGMMPGGVMQAPADGKDPHAGLSAEQLAAAGTAMAPAQEITDKPPSHWKKQPPSAMLLSKYQIEGADGATVDVTFSTLRSAPGSLLANINRWRGQLGQEPFADDAALKENTRMVPSGFGEAVFVEIEGLVDKADPKKDGRLLGAIAEKGANAWFFKLRGNAALAAAESEIFINWIASVKAAETSKVPMHGTAPGEGITPPRDTAVPAGDGSVTWNLPDGWVVVKGSSARYATIAITGADGTKGELAVTHFPGDVGGDLANVNRWRGQIGLTSIGDAELSGSVVQVTAGPKTIKLIDATGPQNRCAAGWTAHGGETWFFKFTGPDALVGAEKAKFTAFLESIRFNKPE